MLTKTEKIIMYVIGFVALVLGVICCIPFRTLASSSNCFTAEYIVKFIVFPILILGSVVYPNILKYKEIASGKERRKVINVLCYLPLVLYLVGILTFALHTLTFKYYPMTESAHSVLMIMCSIYLVLLVCLISKINNITMSFTKLGNILFDSACGVLVVVFVLLTWRVTSVFSASYANVEGFIYGRRNYDPYLFIMYIAIIAFCVCYVTKFIRFVKSSEVTVYVENPTFEAPEVSETEEGTDTVVDGEVVEEAGEVVEEVGATIVGTETVNEVVKEVPYDGSNKLLQGDSETKQKALKELDELNSQLVKTDSLNDEKVAAQVEELKNKIAESKASLDGERAEMEALKAELTKAIEELEAKVEEITPEVPEVQEVKEVAKKVLKPSVDQIKEYADSLKEEDWVIKGELKDSLGTVKYSKGKVLFLIIQGTKSDYRITFLATQKKWGQLLKSSKSITFPKNAKSNKWLKFVNKGVAQAGLVKGLIREAVKGAAEEVLAIQKAKEEEKARKAAEKKALKEAAKQAAKAANE